jgi:anti-sigma regulatory factor (Ser/Thr protein kinase)
MSSPEDVRTPRHPGYRHEAFFYAGRDEFLAGCVPFVAAAVAADEPVMVALVPERLDLLRRALGSDAARVCFVDMAELGRNPARILPAWRAFVDEAARDGRPVRGIGEPIWAGRRDAEIVECQLHEALLNMAVDPDVAFWLRCPYDVSTLPASVAEAAQYSHPVLVGPEEYRGSTVYEGLHHVQSLFGSPLPEPEVRAPSLSFGADDLPTLRRMVERTAAVTTLTGERLIEFDLAVHEIAANSVRHGGGSGRFRVWSADDAVSCEVADAGHISDPLVGRSTPEPTAEDGRGIWLANQLADLVQVRSTAQGTTVRLTDWLSA